MTQEASSGRQTADVALRVCDVPSATNGVVSVTADAPISRALTLMMVNGYSQLPVLKDGRLEGVISWTSIGRQFALARQIELDQAIVQSQAARREEPLLPLLRRIASEDYVFVRDQGGQICGIVTSADLTLLFDGVGRPFLTLGEIEKRLRILIARNGTGGASLGEKIEELNDLPLSGLISRIDDAGWWDSAGWRLDRDEFVAALNRVRRIRNGLMHFRPEPPGDDDLLFLDGIVRALQDAHDD